MRHYLRERYQRWLHRRIPASREVTLNQRNIFIFPTRRGLVFALLLLMLLFGGINYENNMVFATAFLLISLFVVSIHYTFGNLSALTLKAGPADDAFAGEYCSFEVVASRNDRRDRFDIDLTWPGGGEPRNFLLDHGRESRVALSLPASERGLFRPGRLLLETRFPLGLCRAWSWLDLELEAIIYPAPVNAGPVPPAPGEEGEGYYSREVGMDDFAGYQKYQPGDSLKHVAWKAYAKEQPLMTKQFRQGMEKRVWLDWEMVEGLATEERLSRLCYWVLQLDNTEDEYGLRIPGVEIKPDRGDAHRLKVLRALALLGMEEEA